VVKHGYEFLLTNNVLYVNEKIMDLI
jgi:hypothetical protein